MIRTDLLQAARHYHSLGFLVIPLRTPVSGSKGCLHHWTRCPLTQASGPSWDPVAEIRLVNKILTTGAESSGLLPILSPHAVWRSGTGHLCAVA